MSIKSTIIKEVSLLLEKRIAQISTNINVSLSFDLVKFKGHVDKRMSGRSLEGYDNRPITNSEIKYFVTEFSRDIAEKIIYGEIEDGDSFVIKSVDKGLSIALKAVKESNLYWKMIVLTVFRESPTHSFKVGRNQVVIEK
jgi:hypothetical protein